MSAEGPTAASPLFSARVMVWVVLIGVFSFSALLVLSAYAPDLRSGSNGGAHALSRSAVGYAGTVELLKSLGDPVVVSRGPPPAVRGGSGVLVLTPTIATDPKEIGKLHFAGMVVAAPPKWATAPQPLKPAWVDRGGLLPADAAARPLGGAAVLERRQGLSRPVLRAAPDAPMFDPGLVLPLGEIDSFQTLSGPGWRPVLVDERGRIVLAASRSQPILVLSDPDLLNTHGLADLATARGAVAILDGLRGGGPVVFDVTLDGLGRSRSLLKLAFQPPLLGVTLCLATAALMMGLHAAFRFGPTAPSKPALALGKRALADNSAALVRMAKRESRMAAPYAALTREAAARAVGAPRDLSPDQLDALLDRLGVARGLEARFSALVAEAGEARNRADLMQAARRLFQWRGEMTRDGR